MHHEKIEHVTFRIGESGEGACDQRPTGPGLGSITIDDYDYGYDNMSFLFIDYDDDYDYSSL